jgi:hypothetical protein
MVVLASTEATHSEPYRGDPHDHQEAEHDYQEGTHGQRLRRFASAEYSKNVKLRRGDRLGRMSAAVADLELGPAVFKTCPWQPRELIDTGLRQWLRCCAPALWDNQVIGMPSYSAFCKKAYGEFLHHHPEGGAPAGLARDPIGEQLRRTVVAWTLVAKPGEQCVLWDLDTRVGVDEPWGLDPVRVAAIQDAVTSARATK